MYLCRKACLSEVDFCKNSKSTIIFARNVWLVIVKLLSLWCSNKTEFYESI